MFILASKSPRRKQLLSKIINDFIIIPSDVDESKITAEPLNLSLELSKLKAKEIFNKYPNDIVLACDTVVILDSQILGKPKDKEDARKMLKLLSDKKHLVVTGYTYINKNKIISRKVITEVYFNKLSDELINKYVDTLSPLDKAGGYGIQDKDFPLVKKIIGSYDNVMGLPTEDIKKYCFK